MLQLAVIRENRTQVIAALSKRNMDAEILVDAVLNLDEQRRATQVALDNVLAEANVLSKQIGDLMKSGAHSEATELKAKTAQLKEQTAKLKEQLELYKRKSELLSELAKINDNLSKIK